MVLKTLHKNHHTSNDGGCRFSYTITSLLVQAAMGLESKEGWEEIMDSRLTGNCNIEELGAVANIAYKCVVAEGRRRPRMRSVAQSLSKLGKKLPIGNGMCLPPIEERALNPGQWSSPAVNRIGQGEGNGFEMV